MIETLLMITKIATIAMGIFLTVGALFVTYLSERINLHLSLVELKIYKASTWIMGIIGLCFLYIGIAA